MRSLKLKCISLKSNHIVMFEFDRRLAQVICHILKLNDVKHVIAKK